MKKAAFVFLVLFLTVPGQRAFATTITFEDQPAGSSFFSGTPATLTYNFGGLTVTLTGGR